MALFEQVKEVIVKELAVAESQVTEDATFDGDLRADSLDVVTLVMALEDEFSITIAEEDAQKMTSVGDVVRYLEEKEVNG